MLKFRVSGLLLLALFNLAFISSGFSQTGSKIAGAVVDATTGDPLPGANVFLQGTSIGGTTDINGMYEIPSVPAGSYSIRVTYIGYEPTTATAQVKAGANLNLDFKLQPVALQGKEVVVTAQASGQNEAINQQLSSMQIKDVVSAARIQELPDANAAESVSRLPGISVLRTGGEADQVVVRGLAPKYNEVTINGVQMAASDPNDRSTDLSMISSDMLSGIDVAKTVTPDMDANVFGGVVNFDLREAKVHEPGVPKINLLAQGGYNGLSDVYNKFNNYKYVGSVEDRFFDGQFGVFVQASYERRNLSDNELGATYGPDGYPFTDYLNVETQNGTTDDIVRDRQRGNGAITLDYKLPEGKIILSNFFSSGVTRTDDRQQFYNVAVGGNNQNFNALYTNSTLNDLSNLLSYEQQAWIFHVKASLSHSYSETRDPNDWTVNFLNDDAGFNFGNAVNIPPSQIVQTANNNLATSFLNTVTSNYIFTRERDYGAALDFYTPVNFSDEVTAVIKFGGKYQLQTRSYNKDVIDGESLTYASGAGVIASLQQAFPNLIQLASGSTTNVLMAPFIDPTFSYGTFLGGNYSMVYPLNFNSLGTIVNYMNSHQLPSNINYNNDVAGSASTDYSGREDISAAYVMATIDVGPLLTIIPGVRFQQLRTDYIAEQGYQGPDPYNNYAHVVDTAIAYHPYWLPDLLVRFKPLDWFDVRLAYTNTVSYPDYAALAPIIIVNTAANTIQNNEGLGLSPMRSANYDAYFSAYDNTIGLFTAGAFLKQIKNLIYQYNIVPNAANVVLYYPNVPGEPKPSKTGITVTEYYNSPYTSNNYGMELDWQTHFWYLPGPLTGLVLNANFTHIFSKTQYKTQYTPSTRGATPVDTFYYAPLIDQPDDIINLTVGYDYMGFSIRVSSIYSTQIFATPTTAHATDAWTSKYNRWDIALKQDLPLQGLQIYANLSDLNGANDVSAIPYGFPNSEQSYDYTVELGLRFQL